MKGACRTPHSPIVELTARAEARSSATRVAEQSEGTLDGDEHGLHSLQGECASNNNRTLSHRTTVR